MAKTLKEIKDCFETLAKQVEIIENETLLNGAIKLLRKNPVAVDFKNNTWLEDIPAGNGIYFFEAQITDLDASSQEDLDKFYEDWNNEKGDVHRPRCIKKRMKALNKQPPKNNWIPFYLGKSESLRTRIAGHVYGFTEGNFKTWALRMSENPTPSIERIESIRISTLKLELDKNAYSFVGYLEKALRERLIPIIGRQ